MNAFMGRPDRLPQCSPVVVLQLPWDPCSWQSLPRCSYCSGHPVLPGRHDQKMQTRESKYDQVGQGGYFYPATLQVRAMQLLPMQTSSASATMSRTQNSLKIPPASRLVHVKQSTSNTTERQI